ncbi:MAG: hypothetical protein ABSE40_24760 [Candidatus Sulfotelmatobacter sp.]|jgi:hypothetical protein
MSPTLVAKKLIEFDPKTFLSTMDAGRKIAAFPKRQPIFVQGELVRLCFLFTERKDKTHRFVEDREGSHNRNSERG